MADQKALKKRLKVLMGRPENQVCSDCPERQPRWASLIVPPPGAPEGSLQIGAFCCLECSGSHRRLGVHISFVRSINLDSWKEKEVLAMENGGNAKVNAIFEANLARSGVQKPSNHADGQTRERFIRDKYERRKFYDPNAFHSLPAAPVESAPSQQRQQQVGPPSDVARQRVAARRGKSSNSGSATTQPRRSGAPRTSSGTKRVVAKAPVSAPPPTTDLLDLSGPPAPAPVAAAPASGGGGHDLFDFLVQDKNIAPKAEEKKPQQARSNSQDILSLYNNTGINNSGMQQSGMGMMPGQTNNMAAMNNMMGQMNRMNLQQQQQQQMSPQQQQQMMMMYQQQQQMMMQQQQQMMMQQQSGRMNPNMMMMNQQNGNFGAQQQRMQPAQQTAAAQQEEDPFAQFGMNVFRS